MNLQFFGGSGAKSGRKSRGGGNEDTVMGIPQSQIDQLRGTRDHLGKDELTPEVIQQDFARVGIQVSKEYAEAVHHAIFSYTGYGYSRMFEVAEKERKGEPINDEHDKESLRDLRLLETYTKVAPVFKATSDRFGTFRDMVYRGVRFGAGSKEYDQQLKELKVGDVYSFLRLSSFSTFQSTAEQGTVGVSGYDGVLFHIPIKNKTAKYSISIRGAAQDCGENELLFYNPQKKWRVKEVYQKEYEEQYGSGIKHVILEPDA